MNFLYGLTQGAAVRLVDFFFALFSIAAFFLLINVAVGISSYLYNMFFLDDVFSEPWVIGFFAFFLLCFFVAGCTSFYNFVLRIFASDYVYWRYHSSIPVLIYRMAVMYEDTPTQPEGGSFWGGRPSPWRFMPLPPIRVLLRLVFWMAAAAVVSFFYGWLHGQGFSTTPF